MPVWLDIVIAVAGIFLSVVAVWIPLKREMYKDAIKREKRQQKIDDTLAAMMKKLDEHNGYAEKFAKTHEDISLIRQDMTYVKKEIDEVKESIHKYHDN